MQKKIYYPVNNDGYFLAGQVWWSGMIGKVVNGSNAIAMIASPLTLTPERSDVITFTKPFMYQGITILVKQVSKLHSSFI